MQTISFKEIVNRCHDNKRNSYSLYYKHRLLSLPLTKIFYSFDVQPNTISISMILLSLLSFFFMLNEAQTMFFIGYILAFLAFLFDKVDGDLARLYSIDNLKGSVFDLFYHRISLFLFYLGIGLHYSYESSHIIIIAAVAGFLANYIEEMQLISFRVFAHKFLLKGENIGLRDVEFVPEFKLLKLLKIFRFQVFLFYYFIVAVVVNIQFDIQVTRFVEVAAAGLCVYSVYQIFYVHKISFDNDINELNTVSERRRK